MLVYEVNGVEYRLPNALNNFQRAMYIHLINWKWSHITREPGEDRGRQYDAILPESYAGNLAVLYPDIVGAVREHLHRFPFREHRYLDHMASSPAANINPFLPVLLSTEVNAICSELDPRFARLATEHLDRGWRIEFWDEPFGTLADKTPVSGTDADLAIAYYDGEGALCLWLIEHKLTEAEFTACGGAKSRGRQGRHDCSRSFIEILANKALCYYHDVCAFEYWNVTESHRDFFAHAAKCSACPFRGGMNQLWRNQLLALSIEQDDRQPYEHAHFSVVRHPRNTHLDASITGFADLISHNPKFSVLTSADVLRAAERHADATLRRWMQWYRDLYDLKDDDRPTTV